MKKDKDMNEDKILKKEDKKVKPKMRSLSLIGRSSSNKGKWERLMGDKDKDKKDNIWTPPNIIGLPLEKANQIDPSFDHIPLPSGLRRCIDYVEEYGLCCEGIYRVSSPLSRLDLLEMNMNKCIPLQFNDPHEAAGLLKRYLRSLPRPIIPQSIISIIEDCSCKWRLGCTCGVIKRLRESLGSVPRSLRYLLAYIFIHAQNVIAMERSNKMGVAALGLLLQRILDLNGQCVLLFLMNSTNRIGINDKDGQFIFDDIPFKRLRVPRTIENIDEWNCDDYQLIQDEIELQEGLISHLHSQIRIICELNGDMNVSVLEDRLWNAQAALTKLRRRKNKWRMERLCTPTTNTHDTHSLVGEKQLLAVHCMLKEDVDKEMMEVAILLWRIQSIEMKKNMKMNEDDGNIIDDKDEDEDRIINELKEGIRLEESIRDNLLSNIISLRNECAQLRGELEMNQCMSNMTLSARF